MSRRLRRHRARRWIPAVLCALASTPLVAAEVRVEVTGLGSTLAANVRAYLSVVDLAAEAADDEETESGDAAAAAFERDLRRAHSNSRVEIEAALRPFGYYSPSVETSLEQEEDDGPWRARYVIEAGPPTVVDEVDIVVSGPGREVPELRRTLEALPIAAGNRLLHSTYETTKSRLFDSVYNAGFLDAAYTRSELAVRPEAREADVHLHLETGPRYYFGDIAIEQDILEDEFVRRYVEIEPDDPFDPDRLIDLQLALGDSGYFNNVAVDVRRGRATDGRIPVAVRAEPRPNQQFTVGAGYGTDTGPRLRLGLELRRINRKGHRITTDLRTSARENAVAAEYRVPVGDPRTDYFSYRGTLSRQEVGDFDVREALLGFSWNAFPGSYQRSVYVEARHEAFRIDDGPERSEDALYPGVRFSGKVADNPLLTRRGYAWTADLRAGSKRLAGSASFIRVKVDGQLTRPLGERGRFLLRGEFGAIRSGEFEGVLPSQRFFTGGDRTVRGYEFETLGPENADGAVIGGRYLAVAGVELDYLFWGDFGGAIFYDVGNASNERVPDLKRGAGLGLRWRSPVGMLRVDFAHPFDDPENDFRLHLSIGATF